MIPQLQLGEGAIIWRKAFMQLALKYRLLCSSIGMDYDKLFETLSSNFGMLDCFCEMYRIYVQDKIISPIEEMPEDDKQVLWEESKRLLGVSAFRDVRLKLCKAIWFFNAFMQQDVDPKEEEIVLGELKKYF